MLLKKCLYLCQRKLRDTNLKTEKMTTQFTENETIYTTTNFFIKNTEYRVLVVVGKFNYVNVNKICNYRRSLGKDFKNFNEAANAYKNPQIKLELLKIEMGIN